MEIIINNILYSANTILPVFLILFLGYILRRINIIDDPFISTSSTLVYKVALPVFLFLKLSITDFTTTFYPEEILFILCGILFSFCTTWFVAKTFIKNKKDLGVFVQGSFRSNFAIVGLAIIYNIFGEKGLAEGSVILAFIVGALNILSLIVLESTLKPDSKINLAKVFFSLLKVPLIIAVIVSLPFSFLKISIPETLVNTGNYLAALTLPLALLGIGGSLNFSQMKKASKLAISAAVIKIFVIPVILTYVAYHLGFKGDTLGIIFIFFACPTAIVSFIMAKALGGNEKLAGNIIVISTVGSVFTISLGIFLLKFFKFI